MSTKHHSPPSIRSPLLALQVTYNSAISVMKSAGKWKLALKLLRKMRAEQVRKALLPKSNNACRRIALHIKT